MAPSSPRRERTDTINIMLYIHLFIRRVYLSYDNITIVYIEIINFKLCL